MNGIVDIPTRGSQGSNPFQPGERGGVEFVQLAAIALVDPIFSRISTGDTVLVQTPQKTAEAHHIAIKSDPID